MGGSIADRVDKAKSDWLYTVCHATANKYHIARWLMAHCSMLPQQDIKNDTAIQAEGTEYSEVGRWKNARSGNRWLVGWAAQGQ